MKRPTLEELRARAWEASSHLHVEPMGSDGRMVTHQPLLVKTMVLFALQEMSNLIGGEG